MAVVICLLRGVNVGGHNLIRMDALRAVCESLHLRNPRTYLQSGNVVFPAPARGLAQLPGKIANAIEQAAGFRPSVILRTLTEFREVAGSNPFQGLAGLDPKKLLVSFLAAQPAAGALEQVQRLNAKREELRLMGRELFIYFPDGIAASKLSMPSVDRALGTSGTARNWNTVMGLLALAEKIGQGSSESSA